MDLFTGIFTYHYEFHILAYVSQLHMTSPSSNLEINKSMHAATEAFGQANM